MDGGEKYMNTSTTKSGTKVTVGIFVGIVILLPIVALLGTLFYQSSRSTEVNLQDNTLIIKGIAGTKIDFADILSITKREQIPEIIMKTGGAGLGSKLKGNYKLKEIGQAKLFVDKEKPPFIYIKTTSDLIIINTDNPTDTEKFYEELKIAWDKSNISE